MIAVAITLIIFGVIIVVVAHVAALRRQKTWANQLRALMMQEDIDRQELEDARRAFYNRNRTKGLPDMTSAPRLTKEKIARKSRKINRQKR